MYTKKIVYTHKHVCIWIYMCHTYTYIRILPKRVFKSGVATAQWHSFCKSRKIMHTFISGFFAFYSKFVHNNWMLAIGASFLSFLSLVLNTQLNYLGLRRLSWAERAASRSPWRFFLRPIGVCCVLFITAATLRTLMTDWELEFRNAYEWCAASVSIIGSASRRADGLSLLLFLGWWIPNWITGLISGLQAPI